MEFRKSSVIATYLSEQLDRDNNDSTILYCAQIISSLIQTKTVDKDEYK